MKRILLPVFMLGLLGLTACNTKANDTAEAKEQVTAVETTDVDTLAAAHPEYLPEVAIGAMAPEIAAPDTLGHITKLSDYRGKYVVVDFWASWCGDCRREIPELIKISEEYQGKKIKDADVQFLGYSFDREEEAWRTFLRKSPCPWPQVSTLEPKWHENAASQAYGLHWIPAFVLVNPEGVVVGKAITAVGLRQLLLDEQSGMKGKVMPVAGQQILPK